MHESARAALEDHLRRLSVNAHTYAPDFAKRLRLPLNLLDWPDTGPTVAIIIPTHNGEALLRRCVESILSKTSYANYRVVIVDNDSDDPGTLQYLRELAGREGRIERISNDGGKFSFSRINNLAVRRVKE